MYVQAKIIDLDTINCFLNTRGCTIISKESLNTLELRSE